MVNPPRPQDYKDSANPREAFMDGYNAYIAKVDLAQKFLTEFDPANIEANIRNLSQQLARLGIG